MGQSSFFQGRGSSRCKLTLMLRLGNKLADHGLDNSDVAVQETANSATKKRNPDIWGET